MAAEHKMPVKKFKITTKQVRNGSEVNSREKTIVDNGQRNRFIGGGGSKHVEVNVLTEASMSVNFGKRKPECLDGQRAKKQKLKMDPNLKLQLTKILKELISHSSGWIFSEPVDPVKLQVPDYFEIITKPMDLGTIRRKLGENMYSDADEFAADVRLTFANAMLYNPPCNEVHQFAKTLDAAFRRKWKLVEAKLKHGKKNDEEASRKGNNGCETEKIGDNNHHNMKPIGLNRAPLPVRLMSLEEKQKFRQELVQVTRRKMIVKLQTVFQKFGLAGLNKERLDSYIDLTDDETLWKLRREVKVLLSAKDGKVKAGKIALNGCSSLSRAVEKEHCCRSALESAMSTNQRQSIDSTCLRNGATQGCGSGWTFDVPMSPKKALRVAMLKKRFADTIFRATHQELLDHGDKSDPVRIQQERERLEREHQEEKARIEAQIKAAEAASQRREQEDLKMQREKERKAARMALEKIERSVEINVNVGILKGLEMMGCGCLYYPIDGNRTWFDGIHPGSPLEQLGLYLKDDFLEEDEAAILNREEGEILL